MQNQAIQVIEKNEDAFNEIMLKCQKRHIKYIEFSLSGGGDEGDATLEKVIITDDSEVHIHKNSEIGGFLNSDIQSNYTDVETGYQTITNSIHQWLELASLNAPSVDWVNNSGGSGTVWFMPFEEGNNRLGENVENNVDEDDDADEDDF